MSKNCRVLTDWGKRNPVYASGLLSLNSGMVAGASIPITVVESEMRWFDITIVLPIVQLISYTNLSSVKLPRLSNEVIPPCPQARVASRIAKWDVDSSESWLSVPSGLDDSRKLSASEV